MKKIKYIFFDFNGTLVNDVDLALFTINELLSKRKLKLLSKEEYKNIFCFPVVDYYQLAGLDLEKESFDYLAKEWVEIYYSNKHQSTLYNEVIPVLEKLKNDYKLVVLSASKEDLLIEHLEELNIKHYFEDNVGINNIYASSKLDRAIDYFNQKALNREEVLFVGDTTHDKEVADFLKVKSFLVTHGHQSKKVLEKTGTTLIDSLLELIDHKSL